LWLFGLSCVIKILVVLK